MSLADKHGQPHEELDAALRTLNSVRVPDHLVDRLIFGLKHARQPRSAVNSWRPLLLTPLALAVVVLACITVARQSTSLRPQVPPVGRTQAPSRTVTLPDSASAPPPLAGGRRVLPAQPHPMVTAHTPPTVPFAYPQTRESQLRLQSAAQARITDKAVFDPRSSMETDASKAPK